MSIVDATRRNNFALQQRLILFFVGAAIFKHWERCFTEDVETVGRCSETNVLQKMTHG